MSDETIWGSSSRCIAGSVFERCHDILLGIVCGGNNMKLSELIKKIGDENVEFQNLDNDILRLNYVKGHTEVTFGTSATMHINGSEKLGLVVWLDRDEVERVTKGKPKTIPVLPGQITIDEALND